MSRKRRPGSLHRKKLEVAKNQSEELIYKESDNMINTDIVESADHLTIESSDYEYEDYVRSKKCSKSKHNCDEICYKYNIDDCNFDCDSDKELLIRIICLLINKDYGLKAIEQKIKKAELSDDIKNIVKKVVDSAGTVTDITSGLANIAAGAAGTAGSVAQTVNGLATVAAGTAGTAGAGAVAVAETAGIAAAGAATVGAAADTAAAVSGTVAGLAATAAGAAETTAAVSDIIASGAAITAGAAATTAAVSGLKASKAATASNAKIKFDELDQIVKESIVHGSDNLDSESLTTGPVVLDTETDTIQVWVLNNNSEPTSVIDITMYDLTVNPKTGFYMNSSAVPANSSVFFTIASVPAVYELQIMGLTSNVIAYAVLLNRTNDSLNIQTPMEARILCMYP